MSNEIEIVVKSRDAASRGFDSVRSSSRRMQDDVRKASLDVEAAQIRVDKATKNLVATQAKHEAGSVQVREAENRLAKSQFALEQASGKLANAERGVASGARQAAQDVEKAGAAADHSRGRFSVFGGILSSVGRTAALALGGVVIAAGAAGVAGATMGLKTAASLEQANISYTTLLHSTDAAKQHVEDLTKFAANTPFELPGLIQMDRLLIGAGESATKTIGSLTAWGDASGALGQTQEQFSRTMLAVSQAMNKGKLQGEELMQITEAGIPIWKLLSEATGKPIPVLQKLSSEGKLLTSDVLPKLEKQMQKDYGGSMAKQSQTLAGLWSTFMDTLNIGLAKAIQPLIPVLKDAMPGAMNAIASSLAWVARELPVVIGFFRKQTAEGGFLREALDRVSGAVHGLASFWSTYLVPIFKFFGEIVAPVVKMAISNVKSAIEDARNSGVPWVALLKTLGVALGLVAGVIAGAVVVALAALSLQLRMASAFVKPLWEAFRTASRLILGFLGVIINGAAAAFGWIPGIGPKLQAAAKEFNKFRDSVNRALAGITDRQVTVTARAVVNGTTITSYSSGVVSYRNSGGSRVQAKATGGVVGAATGGIQGNLVEVGEHGRELVRLPVGSQAYSNPDTERMLSGGSGGVQRVELEWVGGNGGDEFMAWLRKNIRVRGGLTSALGGA